MNCEAPMTVARMPSPSGRPAGSSPCVPSRRGTRRPGPGRGHRSGRLAAVDVLGHAAGGGQPDRGGRCRSKSSGSVSISARASSTRAPHDFEQTSDQLLGQAASRRRTTASSSSRGRPCLGDQRAAARCARYAPRRRPPGGRRRGSAAVEGSRRRAARRAWSCRRRRRCAAASGRARRERRDGADAVRGQDAFEVVAGRSAHELAALAGEQVGDAAGVGAFEGRAGEDHRTGVDLFGG